VLAAICLDNRGFEARYDIGSGVVWCGVVCSAVIEIYLCWELHSNRMLCTAMHCYAALCDAMGYLADSRGTERRKEGRKVRLH
jgi:hypothetical protein